MEKKRTALVTGSSQGIGRSIAINLGKSGYEVVVHYKKNEIEAREVVNLINQRGGKAYCIKADLGNYKEAINLGNEAWDLLGGIDLLINNAGVSYKKPFLESEESDFDYFTDINFRGTFFLTKTVANRMVAQNLPGGIYTITSINGIRPSRGFSLYGATKGALEALMKGVALELATYQIKVNTIALGGIRTEINKEAWENPEKLKEVNQKIPIGRLGTPEEIADLLYPIFMSNTYMTGCTLLVDGGWLLNK